MSDLKPCPVCGFADSKSEGWFVFCEKCGCRSVSIASDEEEAIEIWNEMCDMKDKYKEEKQKRQKD